VFKNEAVALIDGRPKRCLAFLEIMGTDGMIRFGNDPNYTFELWLPSAEISPALGSSLRQHPFPGVSTEESVKGPAQGRFVCPGAIDDIVACLDEDRESISSGWHARQAMEIYMGMYRSHYLGGSTVKLPNEDRSLYRPEAVPTWVLEAEKAFS
jgi:hypothetical protein